VNSCEALVMSKLKVASHQQVHESTRLSTSRVHAGAAAAQNLTTTTTTLLVERPWRNTRAQYSIPASGPMPIPVSRQSAHRLLGHKSSGRLLLLFARPTVKSSAAQHHHRIIQHQIILTSTRAWEQLVQCCYMMVESNPWPLVH